MTNQEQDLSKQSRKPNIIVRFILSVLGAFALSFPAILIHDEYGPLAIGLILIYGIFTFSFLTIFRGKKND